MLGYDKLCSDSEINSHICTNSKPQNRLQAFDQFLLFVYSDFVMRIIISIAQA